MEALSSIVEHFVGILEIEIYSYWHDTFNNKFEMLQAIREDVTTDNTNESF